MFLLFLSLQAPSFFGTLGSDEPCASGIAFALDLNLFSFLTRYAPLLLVLFSYLLISFLDSLLNSQYRPI